MERRAFLKVAAMAGTAALIPWRRAYAAFARTIPLRKFIQPLRGLGGDGIPVAQSIPDPRQRSIDSIVLGQHGHKSRCQPWPGEAVGGDRIVEDVTPLFQLSSCSGDTLEFLPQLDMSLQ